VDTDRDLFWALLEVEHPKVEAFCRRLTGDLHDGDDLYHDALLVAMRKFEKLRQRNSFRPWIYRIIINTFNSGRRSPWRRRRVELTTEIVGSLSGDNPIHMYDARRWTELGLAALSPDDRALVTLFEIEGWSVAELSEMLGRSPGTIKSRLSRARHKMRDVIARCLPQKELKKLKDVNDYALPKSQTEIG
jgi:RNA polymerase sigma-70 factor (ECF subfamily)